MYSKRGQVTLFVIIAVVIVAVVVLAIILAPRLTKPKAQVNDQMNPETYIADCINDELEHMVKTIAEQGGSLELKNCIFYKDICRTYLCYQNIPNTACVNQEPMLKGKIESRLKTKLQQENIIPNCVDDFKQAAIQKQYSIDACTSPQFAVILIPGKVTVQINCSISLDRNDEHKRFTTINPALDWPLYEFVITTGEIINTEILNTDFDPSVYISLNPWIDIYKFRSSDEIGTSKIYVLKDRVSGNEFGFALKNNYWVPAGVL